MATESQAPERNVTIYHTVGQNKRVIRSAAVYWEDLQKELLDRYQISTDNMKVVIGETQNSLESARAVLLNHDFSLLMMPQKVKSGSSVSIF